MYKSVNFVRLHKAYFVVGVLLLLVVGLFIIESGVKVYLFAALITLLLLFLYFYNKNGSLMKDVRNREREIALYQDILRQEHYCVQLDSDLVITYVNQKMCRLLRTGAEEMIGKPLRDFISLEDYPKKILELVAQNGRYQSSGLVGHGNHSSKVDVVLQKKGVSESGGYYLVVKKPDDAPEVTNAIREELFKDTVTGLPTRLKLFHDIEEHRTHALFPKSTLLYLSIDNFDTLNEIFGIDAGNIIHKRVAEWLQKDLPIPQANIYRIDFNHFAIFVPKYLKREELEVYLQKIISRISKEEFSFQGSLFNIELTAGVARGSANLPKNAYLALKEAEKSKKSYKIYDEKENHHARFLQNIKTNKMVKEAISEQRVEPFFQPIFNLRTNEVERYESLMRIRRKDNSYATPAEFLEIAKTSKMYTELSRAMIKKCFEQLESVHYPITINISIEDILEPRVAQYILRKLKREDIGRYITFEIVESESISGEIKVKNFIRKVKSYGCQIAIDDFGSGFSNFGQLMSLDADYIKIDGSLIKNITRDKESEIMTRSIISMAKELGMLTVAEFVSSQAIFDKVKSLGIDYAQGYFIDRADPVLLKQVNGRKS